MTRSFLLTKVLKDLENLHLSLFQRSQSRGSLRPTNVQGSRAVLSPICEVYVVVSIRFSVSGKNASFEISDKFQFLPETDARWMSIPPTNKPDVSWFVACCIRSFEGMDRVEVPLAPCP